MEIDYEKAYKAALETATQWIKDGCTDRERICLENAFPQIRESEDERMIRILKEGLEGLTVFKYTPVDKIFSWLEKQKEHQENCTKFLAKILKHSAEGFRNILKKKGIDYIPHESFWTGTAGTFSKQECNEFYKWMDDMTMELVTEETPEYKKGFRDGLDASKKEQKLTESISRLTVQGKGVYKICPRCKERMVRDDSKVYTSMPPQYGYNCPKCGTMEFDTVRYDNPEMDEQIIDSAPLYTIEQVDEKIREAQEWSEEDEKMLNLTKTQLRILQSHLNHTHSENMADTEYSSRLLLIEKCVSWLDIRLKSLRPQPNTVPVESAIKFGEREYERGENDGIQSEKSRQWKPSEEQMRVLKQVEDHVAMKDGYWEQVLDSLYLDLQKL